MKIIAAIILSFVAIASSAYAAEIVAMRASVQKDFHRLTIIFSEDVPVEVSSNGEHLFVKISEFKSKLPADSPVTEYLKVEGLAEKEGQPGRSATLDITLIEGATFKHSTLTGPFRMIIDVFPPPGYLAKKEQRPKEVFILEPDPVKLVAFNDSWRWVYRKKAVVALKAELYAPPPTSPFRIVPGVSTESRDSVLKGITNAVSSHKAKGERSKAEVLGAIANFYSGKSSHIELENALRANPASGYSPLAYFIMGDYFERKGFYPEASGYFIRAIEGKDNQLKAEAVFRRGRLYFFEEKYAQAKDWFSKSLDAGYEESRVWLANTLLIKGETEPAWKMYRAGVRAIEELDPVTRLSLGDMHLARGNYQEARYLYGGLRSRYPKEDFMSDFLLIKEGDTLFAEGKAEEAALLYNRTKDKLKGEQWAMAALALADAYFASGEGDSVGKAEKIYETVATGSFASTEVANLRLVAARLRLGRYPEAYGDISRFYAKYPVSPVRQDLEKVSSILFYEWLDSLYRSGDHLGVLKLFLDMPLSVPFGKKAETYFKIGRSSMETGLNSEAVRLLDNAVKMGTGPMVEDAMLLLARVYIAQNDINSAERLVGAFRTRFPKSAKTRELNELDAMIAFEKGEHGTVSRFTGTADPRLAAMKAESVFKVGRFGEAAALFENAARAFQARGESKEASRAFLRYADAIFETKDFARAAQGYRQAAGLIDEKEKEERSWALYRLAQCFSRLGRAADKARAIEELKAAGGEYAPWSEGIFKEAKGI
ncbi:MAG TPA: hypothetical protein DDW94_03825 [Deltaproteobacteria bacterium]|nr:MAG: hypothetical protein A2Z79_10955 [Deltaproteobacteria bacterium GWA2_55_82]OIJ72821.1 MAG: hypothetical protein A2V21_300250 [Deltaproteobacteria bacterium GWC2_55_46]HBG46099.1 hypothetical protein [Deltaproteobacteria bacterium]HCY11597.1 hypothetical protein [Deltaproteobacteria bacterium]